MGAAEAGRSHPASVSYVTDPFRSSAFRGDIALNVEDAEERLTRGALVPREPVLVARASGRTLMDVIWTTSVHPVLVSAPVVALLESAGLTGWSTYPVLVATQDGRLDETYAGLAVTGTCGPILDELSTTVMKDYPAGRFPVRRGLFFEPSSWDGSDLFISAPPAACVFASSRLRRAFEDASVSNIAFVPIAEVEHVDFGEASRS